MASSGYLFLPEDVQALKYHDLLKKAACLFAGMNHMQPLLLATTNSHYLLDRFCMERCCSSDYISRIVISLIFMEILATLLVACLGAYMVFKDPPIWKDWSCWRNWLTCTGWSTEWQGDSATGDTLNTWNEWEERYRGYISSAIQCLILVGYIQIFYAFTTGGKKGHMHWFYSSLMFQQFVCLLIGGAIGFWEVGLALWYLMAIPMGPIPVFFYQLMIHSWIRNHGPRYPEYLVVEYQIWLAICLSCIAAVFWALVYTKPYIPIELDLKDWETYKSKYENTEGYYTYSIIDDNVGESGKKDIWAGGKCLYTSMCPVPSTGTSITNPTHLYLEVASGGTIHKKYYYRQGTDQWNEHTDSDNVGKIDLAVNGVLGMIISDNTGNNKFRVSIRKEKTTEYVNGTPKLGLYRAYKYEAPSGRNFKINNFIKSGPYGSETLVGVPKPSPTNSIKEVIVYTCLNNTPLLIYYGNGTNTHHWFKNTGKDNTWKSAEGDPDNLRNQPPPTSTTNAPTVRRVLEKVNCTVNGIVQINVQQTGVPPTYCHDPACTNKRVKVSGDKAGDEPYKSLLEDLLQGLQPTEQYTVYQHTPNNAKTLTISAFKNGTDNYLKGIPTAGATNSYITGVSRVVVFLKNSNNPFLIYYERPNEDPSEKHHWYKYSTTGWTDAAEGQHRELRGKPPEDEQAKQQLKEVLGTITTGDANGSETPDSNVTLASSGSLNEHPGTNTPQYNRVYKDAILNSPTWFPLVMHGMAVGSFGSIFPNLIPKTLVCARTSRTLSVVSIFLSPLPGIFNVMFADNGWPSAACAWTWKDWQISWLLYIFYGLAFLFAIFNVHSPEWKLCCYIRSHGWMPFMMTLSITLIIEILIAIARAGIMMQKPAADKDKNHPLLWNKIFCLMGLSYLPFWLTTTPMMKSYVSSLDPFLCDKDRDHWPTARYGRMRSFGYWCKCACRGLYNSPRKLVTRDMRKALTRKDPKVYFLVTHDLPPEGWLWRLSSHHYTHPTILES